MRVSYDWVCEHVLQFLDASLKQWAEAREFLQNSLHGEGLDEEFKLQFRAIAVYRKLIERVPMEKDIDEKQKQVNVQRRQALGLPYGSDHPASMALRQESQRTATNKGATCHSEDLHDQSMPESNNYSTNKLSSAALPYWLRLTNLSIQQGFSARLAATDPLQPTRLND